MYRLPLWEEEEEEEGVTRRDNGDGNGRREPGMEVARVRHSSGRVTGWKG